LDDFVTTFVTYRRNTTVKFLQLSSRHETLRITTRVRRKHAMAHNSALMGVSVKHDRRGGTEKWPFWNRGRQTRR